MESILQSIKKLLGIDSSDTTFDVDVMIHINSVFMDLTQIGVGPSDGFYVTESTNWDDFMPDKGKIEAVKSYVYLRVRLLFDPPASSTVIDSMSKQIEKMEWRLNIAVDNEPVIDSSTKIDYETLKNLPTINGVPLVGNYDEQDPTVESIDASTVKDLWDKNKG